MLKKAGMVVLGATAGMLSLAPLASAGEAPSHGGDQGGHHWQQDDHRGDHGHRGGSCDGGARGSLVNVSDIACDANIGPINVGGDQDNRGHGDHDGRGGRGGHDGHGRHGHGDSLINVSDVLNNLNVEPINALGDQDNRG